MATSKTSKSASTQRTIPARVEAVFEAFSNPKKLAEWWGPNGFRNTFDHFDFQPGGKWIFTMHGPDGRNYPNQSVFREMARNAKIVIEHVSPPRFTLTVSLEPRNSATHLTWVQEFESEQVAQSLRPVVESANEQNLDRLQALLALSPI